MKGQKQPTRVQWIEMSLAGSSSVWDLWYILVSGGKLGTKTEACDQQPNKLVVLRSGRGGVHRASIKLHLVRGWYCTVCSHDTRYGFRWGRQVIQLWDYLSGLQWWSLTGCRSVWEMMMWHKIRYDITNWQSTYILNNGTTTSSGLRSQRRGGVPVPGRANMQ